MGKKRGYAPEELQRAIDLVAENRKDKPVTPADLRASRIERKAADKLVQRRLFAVILAGLAACSVGFAAIRMGWVRFGHPAALEAALASPDSTLVLRLEAQKLNNVPLEIVGLTKLSSLYLDGNQLDSLSPEIARLTELQVLSVSYNKLASLSSSFEALNQLRKISLKANRFQTLPTFITGLKRLEELDISDNALTSLPHDIGKLSNLRVLRVEGNAIVELPESLSQLSELEELYINGNPISALPSPSSFPKLKSLNVKGTKVNDQTAEAFKKKHPKVRLLR